VLQSHARQAKWEMLAGHYGVICFGFRRYCVMRTWTGEPFTNGIERLCNGTLLSDATLVVKQQYEVCSIP
jgi:hypothetical protein